MNDATGKLRILYLDHEGGWGGASRSLWYLLSQLDRTFTSSELWHRQNGPAVQRCVAVGIPTKLMPELPNLTPRAAGHPANWILNADKLLKMRSAALKMIATDAAIFHFNYEGLAPLAWMLERLKDRRPRVLHVRVMNPIGATTRFFVKHLVPLFQHVIFISENERDQLVACGFDLRTSHSILYNPVDAALLKSDSQMPSESPFRAVFFGTLDTLRGADRLVEVAQILKQRAVPVQIDLFGRGPRYRRFLFFKRNTEHDLRNAIEAAGVTDILRLGGHTSSPEAEILRSHIVVRPSRGSDPWGRDVIEAMILGRPVIATGSFESFVAPGETGYLVSPWNPERVADIIQGLVDQPETATNMGRAARKRARMIFDPAKYASHITQIYRDLLKPSS